MDIISTFPWWEFENSSDDSDNINCVRCSKLFDEVDVYTPDDGEGTICSDCRDRELFDDVFKNVE